MYTKAQATLALENIEHAAYLGIVSGVLTALEAGMLRLELANSETEIEALERAVKFIESVKS